AVLTFAGAVLFYLFEFNNPQTLGALGPGGQVQACIFQSVTARTAGFNSLDFAQFHGATLVMYLVLMFIGGSPASCAGGVKTTTAFLIWQVTVSRLIGRRHPTAFGREIGMESVNRAATLILVFFACAA